MTKIAIVSSQAFSLVNFRGSLIRELIRSGISVMALAPDYNAKIRAEIISLGATPIDCNLSRTGTNPATDCLDLLSMAKLLRRIKPDFILTYFIKPVIYGNLAAWIAGVPIRFSMIEGLGYVFTPGQEQHESFRKQFLRMLVTQLYRLALSRAAKVIFLNQDDMNEFCKRKITIPEKSFMLGGIGVDMAEWPMVPAVLKPITFLLAARLLREKGIIEYATAAREIKRCHPATRFILLGGLDPNPGGLSHAEVQTWVDEGLIEWPGHVPVQPWLAQASVYVLPSYREGVPRSTQEAMAMGRPVITCDVPGCRETVIAGVNGFLVPPRDADALVAAMLCFIQQPELIESMGLSSRHLAEERFDAHHINLRLMNVMSIPLSKSNNMNEQK